MLIVSRRNEGEPEMSPDEMQRVIQRMRDWLEGIKARGRYVGSDKLTEEGGKLVTLQNGRPFVTDGPYSEAKEVIGGYFTIRAANYDEAAAVAVDCPYLPFGSVTIRQTEPAGCGDE
jgi:hypothetical protein